MKLMIVMMMTMMTMTKIWSLLCLSELPAEEGEQFYDHLFFFFSVVSFLYLFYSFFSSSSCCSWSSLWVHREITLGAGPWTVWGLAGSHPAASCLHLLCKRVHSESRMNGNLQKNEGQLRPLKLNQIWHEINVKFRIQQNTASCTFFIFFSKDKTPLLFLIRIL